MFKFILPVFFVLSSTAFAKDECVLHFKRVACSKEKEAESFSKCDGKAECDKKIEATSDKDCAKKAMKECENARLNVTKSKEITATYDGKPVMDGKQFCASDRPDFNKCDSK